MFRLERAAAANGLDGILGECGGVLNCATWHVLVQDKFLRKTPAITPTEDAMLDWTAMDRQPNSRLSCQLIMNDELDGLIDYADAPFASDRECRHLHDISSMNQY